MAATRYAAPTFWQQRYKATGYAPFEWYQAGSDLWPLLERFLSPEHEILVAGCGTSRLGPDLYERGFLRVTNVDACATCVESQAARWATMEHMDWSALDLAAAGADASVDGIEDGSFHAVVDKALLDALLTAPDRGIAARRYLSSVRRLLAPGAGPLLIVSHGAPPARLPLLVERPECPAMHDATRAVAARVRRGAGSAHDAWSEPVAELSGADAAPFSSVSVFAVPKPAVVARSAARADDGASSDGSDDSGAEEEEAEEEDDGSVWGLLASTCHFVYVCHA